MGFAEVSRLFAHLLMHAAAIRWLLMHSSSGGFVAFVLLSLLLFLSNPFVHLASP